MKVSKVLIMLSLFALCCMRGEGEASRLPEIGFYSSPETAIQSLEKEGIGYREHFMLGVAYKKKKNYKKALFHFSNGCFSRERDYRLRLFAHPVYAFVKSYNIKSEYYADAVAEIADIFFLYREFDHVTKFVDLLKNDGSAMYRDALLLKSRALSELGRDDEALRTVEDLLKSYRDPESRAVAMIRRASLREKGNDFDGAVKDYAGVIVLDESSWQSAIAAGRLVDIKGRLENPPSDETLVTLSGALCRHKRHDEALPILKNLAAESKDDAIRMRSIRLLARAYAGLNRIKEAEALVRAFDPAKQVEIRLAAADELWSGNKKGAAVEIYRTIATDAPKETAKHALRRIAVFTSDNRSAGFEKNLLDFKERYPDDAFAEYCLWTLGREALKKKDSKAAEEYYTEALGKYPDGENADRMKFWLLRFNEDSGKKDEAERLFRDLVANNPDSTLTWALMERKAGGYRAEALAADFGRALAEGRRAEYLFCHAMLFLMEKDIKKRNARLEKIPSDEKKSWEILERDIGKPQFSSRYSSTMKAFDRYFAVGHVGGINRELSLLNGEPDAQEDRSVALAYFGERYGHYYFSLFSTLEIMRARKLRENISLMPESLLKRLLPTPFNECVEESAKTFKVDSNAVYAVMKAESLFHPRAMSSAGAVGLMQIMPATARGIARWLGVPEYDLKDPCTSIRFGTRYIAGLLSMFNGNFDLVVAGYNAGAGNVQKWRARMPGEDPDYFTEFIPFGETRYYVVRTRKFLIQYGIINQRR
ncbi:MAG TPA: transglycosylase SLT domain-containing protein [Spirochaetota bacterium]|nr:transglycosylase SLT domain-containing protein [Spirochaetota bacterium]